MAINVLQVGAGPIGRQCMDQLNRRNGQFSLVGILDISPELVGASFYGVSVSSDWGDFSNVDIDVAIVSTSSALASILPIIRHCVRRGICVVTSCEEALYAWRTQPELSEEIDALAKDAGVSVLGTGINPGFLMDTLPVHLTALCKSVSRIVVKRYQNAQNRRLPFQQKIGAGLSESQFNEGVASGRIRHVGLTESMDLLAHGLGFTIDRREDVVSPVLTDTLLNTRHFSIKAGEAVGVRQIGRAFCGDEEVLRLEFVATLLQFEEEDSIEIVGSPSFKYSSQDGIPGDISTCTVLLNSIAPLLAAKPGFLSMLDISPSRCFQR